MIFLIQEQLLSIRHEAMLVECLERYGIKYIFVKIRPFTTEILTEDPYGIPEDGSNVLCIGSVKLAHIAKTRNWRPGSFYNENHDFEVCLAKYGNEMLNHDGHVMMIGDPLPERFHTGLFFARPTKDTKAFTGGHFIRDSWDNFAKIACGNNHEGPSTLDANTKVILAGLKTIYREIRCFVIQGYVITASQYRLNDRTIYIECTVLEYAQRMVDLYEPADAFVMDVCETPEGLRIVEINCINCAGFYDCDINRLVDTFINFYSDFY